jgi:hypothetical protein
MEGGLVTFAFDKEICLLVYGISCFGIGFYWGFPSFASDDPVPSAGVLLLPAKLQADV